MKKKVISIVCILSLMISMLSFVGAFASEEVSVLSLEDVMQKGNDIVFNIAIDNSGISYDEARLVVSIYDAGGVLLETQSELVGYDNSSAGVSLSAQSDMASCKIMLLDGTGGIKPLCPSLESVMSLNDIPTSDEVYKQNVRFLSSIGVYNIPQLDALNPRHEVTRAEFTAALIRSIGVDETAKIYSGDNVFEDISSDFWAAGYINLAAESGIANGKSEGLFSPYGTLTYDEAVIAVLRSLGYGILIEKEGGYPYGYIKVAKQTGITEGLESQAVLTADNMAKLISNAVETYHMAPVSLGNDPLWAVLDGKNGNDYKTSLIDMNIFKVKGVVGAKEEEKVGFKVTENSEDGEFSIVTQTDTTVTPSITTVVEAHRFDIADSDIMDYKNQLVETYVHEYERGRYEVLFVSSFIKMNTITIMSQNIIDNVTFATAKIEYYTDDTDKIGKIDVVPYIEAVLNNGYMQILYSILGEDDIELKFIDNTGDGVYDIVEATQYVYDRITRIDYENCEMELMYGGNVYFDFEDTDCSYKFSDIYGTKLGLNSFSEGDIVAICGDRYMEYYIEMIKINDSFVTGTAEEISDDYITVNGVKYDNRLYDEITTGDEGTFYLTLHGGIVMADIGMLREPEGPGESIEEEPEITEEEMTEEQYLANVKLLSDLGMIDAYEHTDALREITRAEFAVSLCNAMNVMDMIPMFSDMEIFRDVPSDHYAAGCINYLAYEGIMSAVDESTFAPEDTVTYKDAMDTAVLALGFAPVVEAEGYPMGSLRTANAYGINDDIVIETCVTSQIFVQMLRNILTIPVMKPVAVGGNDAEYQIMDGRGGKDYTTILTENDIYIATGIVDDVDKDKVGFQVLETSEDGEFVINYNGYNPYLYVNFLIGESDITNYKYQLLDAYVRKSDGTYTVLAVERSPFCSTVEINTDDIVYHDGYTLEYYINGTDEIAMIKINYNIEVELDNEYISLRYVLGQPDVELTFIENNGDNYYDIAIGTRYYYNTIESIEMLEGGMLIVLDTGGEVFIEDDTNMIIEDFRGNKISSHDLSPDDLIAIHNDGDNCISITKLTEKPQIVGMVTGISDRGYITVNGEQYFNSIGYDFEIGNPYRIYLGMTGKICHVVNTSQNNGSSSGGGSGTEEDGSDEGGVTVPDFDIENEL